MAVKGGGLARSGHFAPPSHQIRCLFDRKPLERPPSGPPEPRRAGAPLGGKRGPSEAVPGSQENLTRTSGRFSKCTESINRTCRSSSVKIIDVVRTPSPKNRTPFNKFPSVTPQQAKIIFFPGAISSVS